MNKSTRYLLTGLLIISIITANEPTKNRYSSLSPTAVSVENTEFLTPVNSKFRNVALAHLYSNNWNLRGCENEGPCFDLSYVAENDGEHFLTSGMVGDTFAVVFNPPAACIVQEVYLQWYHTQPGESVIAFGADYGSAIEISPNGDSYNIPRGSTNLSPIGEIRTVPTLNSVIGPNPNWSEASILDIGGTFPVGDENNITNPPPFVIGYVKNSDYPIPYSNDNSYIGREKNYTWIGGSLNDDEPGVWGHYHNFTELMMLVKVSYPWGRPIWTNTELLSNTFISEGTRTIKVDISDDIDDTTGFAITGNDEIHLLISINGMEYSNLPFDQAYEVNVNESGNGTYAWDMTYSANVGDSISYYIVTIDDDGLAAESDIKSFEIQTPVNNNADLLIINDGGEENQIGYEFAADYYSIQYETWSIEENDGIDWSVINHGWSNILIYGNGSTSLPVLADETDPGYGDFLNNGGNLILIDQDWFFGHDLVPYPDVLSFGPGDPAYDWFGINGGVNDPNENIYDTDGEADIHLESLLEELADLNLNHNMYSSTNWGDFITPAMGEPVYQGEISNEIHGIRYDNGISKTALFTFMADAAVDQIEGDTYYLPEFYQFVNYFLVWFDTGRPPDISNVTGPSGISIGANPLVVSAGISATNDDPFTAYLEYSIDDGLTWNSIAMNEVSSIYIASIPFFAPGVTVHYRVSATDENGSILAYDEMGSFYTIFVPTNEILWVFNNEMDGVGIPDEYYLWDDETGNLAFPVDYWFGAVTAELLDFYDIVMEITTTATGEHANHYEIIHDWLGEGDKNYFLAGDDTFGLVNGTWVNEVFGTSSFFHDLGIAESRNDIGSSGLLNVLNAVEDDLLSGAMYNAVPDGSSIMYDPEYEIGFTNFLDGLIPTDDAVTFLTDASTGLAVGIYHTWENDSRTVFCGFDPLSLNSSPEYYRFGASPYGPTIMSANWFTCQMITQGDLNGDYSVDMLDIVNLVEHILDDNSYSRCDQVAADLTGDQVIDLLDVDALLSLWEPQDHAIATNAYIVSDDGIVCLQSDGFVDALQITISHNADINIAATEGALVTDIVTNGTLTNMIIVLPDGNELFTTSGEFEIVKVLAVSKQNFVNVSLDIPERFLLKAAFPNPFNAVTTIGFNVPNPSIVKIIVYNLIGQQVAQLTNGYRQPGNHFINWDAADLPSGMYLVRMTVGDYRSTQKVMLVK